MVLFSTLTKSVDNHSYQILDEEQEVGFEVRHQLLALGRALNRELVAGRQVRIAHVPAGERRFQEYQVTDSTIFVKMSPKNGLFWLK
jgi:hypothetical protein